MKKDRIRCKKCGKWISVYRMRRHKRKRCGIKGNRIQTVDTQQLIQLYLEMLKRNIRMPFIPHTIPHKAQLFVDDKYA